MQSWGKREGRRDKKRGKIAAHILIFFSPSLPPSLPPSPGFSATCFPERVYDALRFKLAERVRGEEGREGGREGRKKGGRGLFCCPLIKFTHPALPPFIPPLLRCTRPK